MDGDIRPPGRNRPVTITDIAAATGVAPSTVSRALNRPGRVNAATRERIQAVAREMDYVANSQARALTSGRTRTIAVLVSDVTNPFYFDMIRGTQQQLKGAGYAQLLIDTETPASTRPRCSPRCAGPSTARSSPHPGSPSAP